MGGRPNPPLAKQNILAVIVVIETAYILPLIILSGVLKRNDSDFDNIVKLR